MYKEDCRLFFIAEMIFTTLNYDIYICNDIIYAVYF